MEAKVFELIAKIFPDDVWPLKLTKSGNKYYGIYILSTWDYLSIYSNFPASYQGHDRNLGKWNLLELSEWFAGLLDGNVETYNYFLLPEVYTNESFYKIDQLLFSRELLTEIYKFLNSGRTFVYTNELLFILSWLKKNLKSLKELNAKDIFDEIDNAIISLRLSIS